MYLVASLVKNWSECTVAVEAIFSPTVAQEEAYYVMVFVEVVLENKVVLNCNLIEVLFLR